MPAPTEAPVDVGAAADPVAAVLAAEAQGRRVALRTSGSTGRARAVVRTPRSWVSSFGHVSGLTGLTADSVLWLPGPLSATMNLFAAVLARWCGARTTEDHRAATHAHLTPLHLARLLDGPDRLDGLHLTVAGERLTRRLRDRAVGAGASVAHYYGAAELSFVGWGTCEEDLRPFPGVEVEVRRGEIWVRSPYLCEGYLGAPGALVRDRRGFATVRDRGRLAGGLLRVAGRGSKAVCTGGATVLVEDVEGVLAAAAAGQVAVVGTPHAQLGQVVTAVLTAAEDLLPAHAAATDGLGPDQRPRRWFVLAPLPMTSAGKVDRDAVARRLADGSVRPVIPTAPPVAGAS